MSNRPGTGQPTSAEAKISPVGASEPPLGSIVTPTNVACVRAPSTAQVVVDGVEHYWWNDAGPEVTIDLTVEQLPENVEIVGSSLVA